MYLYMDYKMREYYQVDTSVIDKIGNVKSKKLEDKTRYSAFHRKWIA